MPLTKQYLRYALSGKFNIVASASSNIIWTTLKGLQGRFVACGACEDVQIWDLQLGERAVVLSGEKTTVSALCANPDSRHVAVGYRDGTVKKFDSTSGDELALFSGHKSAVTCLAFDDLGHRLASGSKDTHIVIWDIVGESGIARLSSHTGPVTQISFLTTYNCLVSSSEDTSIKFWDLDTNHCFKTLLGHRTEVWDFQIMQGDSFLVSGCGDSELRVWEIRKDTNSAQESVNDEEDNDGTSPIKVIKSGSVLRSCTRRVVGMGKSKDGSVLYVHGANDSLELFKFLSHRESLQRLRKRKKRERRKLGIDGADNCTQDLGDPTLQDVVKRLPVIKAASKIKSADIALGTNNELRLALCLANNLLEVYNVTEAGEVECVRRISQQGHRGDVRALAWSSDGLAVASGGADSVKLWNRASLACLRSIPVKHIISLAFSPGDRHLLAGTKDGHLLILDVSVGELIEELPAHTTELWSIAAIPNQRGCVTGGGDAAVKFWDYELVTGPRADTSTKVLSLLHKRTLNLDEPVLNVRVSPDGKLVATALLDMTIKVFFLDTLKFFLSLYGHKLPVTSMDISSDSTLLVSGSADRNIKIWGLDFGDCHKSIFAHDAAVSCVQFIPDTHYFFSCGKDGRIKQWDADDYNKIITLQGHFGEAWTLSIAPNGSHVVSAGSDRVLRLLDKTEEPLVLEDVPSDDEDQLLTGHDSNVRGQSVVNLPTRKTVGSELGAEQLMECLESSQSFLCEWQAYQKAGCKGEPPQRPPLMIAYNAADVDDYIVETIRRIKSSELEEALLLLPFSFACQLVQFFPSLLRKGEEVELIIRTLTLLLKVHHGPIVSSKQLLPALIESQHLATSRVTSLRNMVGCNLYGLQYLQRNVEERDGVQLFLEATTERKGKAKKKKRKENLLKRAVLMV